MKNTFKIIGKWVAPVALAVAFPTAVNSQSPPSTLNYDWVNTGGASSSGSITLTYDSSLNGGAGGYEETSYNFEVPGDFTDSSLNPNDPFDFSDNVNLTPQVMAITGEDQSDTSGGSDSGAWTDSGTGTIPNPFPFLSPAQIPLDGLIFALPDPDDDNDTFTTGYWAAVPEPSTIMSGVLLLAPLAASMVKMLRKRKSITPVQ